MRMRLLLRALLFAAGFLIGGEALRRWLEKEGEEAMAPEPHLRAVPAPQTESGPATDYAAMTRAELYERAKELDIEGRSTMSKAELAEALGRTAGSR